MTDFVAFRDRLLNATSDAALFAVPGGAPVWIPLAHIHTEDRADLKRENRGKQFTVRIDAAAAKEKGLVSSRVEGGAARDLFGEVP